MTILGEHTVHELDDLVKALGFEVQQIQAANIACRAWMQRDPQAFATWNTQLIQAMAGWSKAVGIAKTRIDETPQALWDAMPAEAHFQGCLDAFHPFEDLIRTFLQQSGCTVSFDGVPQPTAPDFDLRQYQLADRATKWIDKQAGAAAAKAKSYAPAILVGLGVVVVAVALAVQSRIRAVLP
jgi:hypothetical protein